MKCEDFLPFIDAYVDGEFDNRERAEAEAHLEGCEDCRTRVEEQLKFQECFRKSLSTESAPDELRQRIFADLEEASRQEQADSQGSVWRYAAVAAPLAASIALVFIFVLPNATTIAVATSEQLPAVEETIDWHKRDYPMEVNADNAREVAGWFRGKVDFPVRLPQFNTDQVKLLGGRLAQVQQRRAAYTAYEVDGARVSVMIFHGDGLKVPGDKIRKVGGRDIALMNKNGYEVAILQDDGVTYTMTSDLPEEELLELVSASLKR